MTLKKISGANEMHKLCYIVCPLGFIDYIHYVNIRCPQILLWKVMVKRLSYQTLAKLVGLVCPY